MQFHPTSLRGAWRIHLEPVRDGRGYFARTFCVDEFAAYELETNYRQHSISFSAHKGTVRGMHYQREPHSEVKVVRCVKGVIWDVIIDIRPDSRHIAAGRSSSFRARTAINYIFRPGSLTVFRRSVMTLRSIISFRYPMHRNQPMVFATTIRRLESLGPCP